MNRSYAKILLAIVVFIAVMTSGCQSNPKDNVVTSKNDNHFDINKVVSATEKNPPSETQSMQYEDEFQSTDGTVQYRIDIDKTLTAAAMPVVEVDPHYITEDDAQRVAHVLFGNADFYEAEPKFAPVYSQSEILVKINRWSEFTNKESVNQLFGYYEENIVDVVKSFIDEYNEKYAYAPSTYERRLCEWKYKKATYYYEGSEKAQTMNLSDDNDLIQATVKVGDVRFLYKAEIRNKDDYKVSLISAHLYDGVGPYMIDPLIYQAQLCRTDKPTDEQIHEVQTKAEMMLESMELGEWKIDQCYLQTTYYGDVPEYVICINAVPVFNGVPAIRQEQPYNLTGKDTYAPNYKLTDVSFRFAGDGQLVDFVLYSPVNIVSTINENTAVMELEALIEKAKNYFMHTDYYQYDNMVIDYASEAIGCNVNITEVDYMLSRIRVPETDANYYYVPTVRFQGTVELYGKETGNVYYYTELPRDLVTLNAVDGSIINTTNQ